MRFFKRTCPKCRNDIPLSKRRSLIFKTYISCSNCNAVLQPTIIWGLALSLMLSFFLFKSFFSYLKPFLGSELTYGLLLTLTIILVKVSDPLSDFKAHDKDEV